MIRTIDLSAPTTDNALNKPQIAYPSLPSSAPFFWTHSSNLNGPFVVHEVEVFGSFSLEDLWSSSIYSGTHQINVLDYTEQQAANPISVKKGFLRWSHFTWKQVRKRALSYTHKNRRRRRKAPFRHISLSRMKLRKSRTKIHGKSRPWKSKFISMESLIQLRNQPLQKKIEKQKLKYRNR